MITQIFPCRPIKLAARFNVRREFLALFAALACTLSVTGCDTLRGWTPAFVQPYRPDVQQGNIVTAEMLDQLRVGMTRDQVRFLLGTPLLTDMFHQDRWDYVYRLKRGKGIEEQQRQLTLFFKDNRLEKFNADPMPPETQADNLIIGRKPSTTKPNVRPSDPGINLPGPEVK